MKPLNLIALLLFLGGAVWALTRSERACARSRTPTTRPSAPFLKSGSALETRPARSSGNPPLQGTRSRTRGHPREARPPAPHRVRFRELEYENAQLRHALDFKKSHEIRRRRRPRHPPQPHHLVADRRDRRRLESRHRHPARRAFQRGPRRQDRPHRQCGGDRSSVLLLTDEKCQVSAASRAPGSRHPQRPARRLRRRSDAAPALLSPNAAVRPGQRVFTTGRGGIFQANILLGTIDSVEKGALDSEALVRPSVNFADLGTVFVVFIRRILTHP
jgi:rod shape-determining protein MreC